MKPERLPAAAASSEVRSEGGWYAAYVDGKCVARLSSRELAENVCLRMASPKGRILRGPKFTAVPKGEKKTRSARTGG